MDVFSHPPDTTDLLAALTPAQREAAAHLDGPLLILAGPGSGKTRVVTHRVANLLLHGVSPSQVLALTFTNKAADEMRQRVERLTQHRGVWMGTFHSFCARLLRRYSPLVGLHENYTIYDSDDSRRVLKAVLGDSEIAVTHTSPDAIANAISWAKNSLVTAEQYVPRPNSTIGALVARLYPEYQQRLIASNACDFDDLLLHVATLLREQPELRAQLDARFRYILVDEYQDTNLAQYAIVRALSIDYPNLAVTGDPDQSIYGWRGANLSNILEFEKDYTQVKVVRLEQNFRSTPNILRVADHLISFNVRRKPKRLFTDNPPGAPVRLAVYPTGQEEADGIAEQIAAEIRAGRRTPREFAVFYRMNALSRLVEHALRLAGIPYQIVSGLEFYQRREIKDVLAYLHLINNPQNDLALLRIINTPTRGIGAKTIERLREYARRRHLTLLEAARQSGLIESIPKRTATQIARFVAAYDRMSLHAGGPLFDALTHVLQESKYGEWLRDSGTEEDQERLANVEELLTAAAEFDRQHPEAEQALEVFLEQASLVADTDALQTEQERVTLMTLHAAKGLEFPVVYIVAAEHGLLPHERSLEDPDKYEEERRLLFVGITRAKQELQVSCAQYRAFRGDRRPTIPSQFLMELPREELAYSEPAGYDLEDGEIEDGEIADDEIADDGEDFDDFADADAPRSGRRGSVWSDEDFVQDAPSEYEEDAADGIARHHGRRASGGGGIGGRGQGFVPGMTVWHPDYGTGRLVAVSGSGLKRTVQVRFGRDEDVKHFLLAHSPLEPVPE
jgi:DNA helicase-2/ATP-dependent DNA helicase PcrA